MARRGSLLGNRSSLYDGPQFRLGSVAMNAVVSPPLVPIGRIKSFGAFGPKYEVGQPIRRLNDGDWMVNIRMVETGEQAEYRYTRLLNDPDAR